MPPAEEETCTVQEVSGFRRFPPRIAKPSSDFKALNYQVFLADRENGREGHELSSLGTIRLHNGCGESMNGFQYSRVVFGLVFGLFATTFPLAAAEQRGATASTASSQAPGAAEMLEAERALLESLTARKASSGAPAPTKGKALAAPQPAAVKAAETSVKPPAPVAVKVHGEVVAQADSAKAEAPAKIDSAKEQKAAEAIAVTKASSAPVVTERKEIAQKKEESQTPPSDAKNAANLVDTTATEPSKAMLKAEAAPPAAKAASDSRAVTAVKAQNSQLRNDLRETQARVDQLLSELDSMRSQLATAEMEVTRLSALVDTRNRNSLSKYSIPMPAAREADRQHPPAASRESDTRGRASANTEVAAPSGGNSLPVATVVVEKADLRLGPGRNNSALMSVSKGSRLLVEARQGEWYRVFAPSGERAWVNSSAVIFGEIPGASNGTASRVKGYDADLEEEAFRKFNSGSSE